MAAPGTIGDETLQVGYAARKDIREQLAEAIYRVDPYLGRELREGQWVILNSQLSVGRVDEDIHWYVRAAAFGHGLALVAGAQGWVKVKRKLVTGDIRQRYGGDGGLGGRIGRATARYHDYSGEQEKQGKEFIHAISPGMTCYLYQRWLGVFTLRS